jgi:hypothetical protein
LYWYHICVRHRHMSDTKHYFNQRDSASLSIQVIWVRTIFFLPWYSSQFWNEHQQFHDKCDWTRNLGVVATTTWPAANRYAALVCASNGENFEFWRSFPWPCYTLWEVIQRPQKLLSFLVVLMRASFAWFLSRSWQI